MALVLAALVRLLLHYRNIGCFRVFHADDMIAGIHMQDFARGAAAELGHEEQASAAHVFQRGVATERCVVFVPFQDVAEITDAGGGE